MTLPLLRFRDFRRVVLLLSLLVVALGASVLIGWAFDIAALKSVFPGMVTMKANTALGMLLCGGTLALLSYKKVATPIRFWTAGMAVLVIVLGMLTLSEDIFGWNLGIDQCLFRDDISPVKTSSPGRLSPSTAFCFTLAGSALLAASQPMWRRWRLSVLAALGATVMAIGGLALAGYVSDALLQAHVWNYTGIAVHTAIGFLLLGWGLASLAQNEGGLTWSLDTLTTLGFVIGIVSLLAATGLSYNFINKLFYSAKWVSHTQEVLKEIEEVRAGMADLESSQRGYIITGDERLLEQRKEIKDAVREDLDALRQLTADNPRQQHRLDELNPLIVSRTDFGEQTITARRKQGFAAAEQMLAIGTGIRLTKNIGGLLKEMRDEEYTLLSQRQKIATDASTTTFLLLPLGVYLSLTILLLELLFLNMGIGEQKQAEVVSAQLAAIVNSSNDAIIGKDLNSIVTSWNLGAERLFGYSANEMIGQSITRLIPFDRRQEELQIINRVKNGETVEHFDTVRVAKDGRLIDLSVTVSPIKDKTGTIVGASKVARDITERKLAENKIHELNIRLEERVAERTAELESANKELEAFSYSVSHDLRAPLRAVDGFSQAVLEDYGTQLPAEGQRYLQTIREGAQRMGTLIDDLLTFSRLSRTPLKKQEVNTGKLVHDVLEGMNSQREGRQVEIRLGDLLACQGDPALLKQVWVNLLSNALKYTRKCEAAVIEIGCKLEQDENVYFVRDNGAGFDMRYVHKLFGVFQRLHRADEFEGTGVGLAIVQRVIHRHGGRIWADAALNRGATFYFTLKERTPL